MAKKFLFGFSVLLLVFALCSCDSNSGIKEQFSLPLKITANLEGVKSQFTADISHDKGVITFEESHALYGTRVEFNGNGNTATVGDFSRSIDDGIFPAQEALIKAVRAVSENPSLGKFGDDSAKYIIDEMTIMVYYDKESYEINRIDTEENGRRFVFCIAQFEAYETQSNGSGEP